MATKRAKPRTWGDYVAARERRSALKHARAERRADDRKWKAAAKVTAAKRAKRAGRECTLTYCSRAIDTPAHRRTAKHRNAAAWARAHGRSTRY